MYNLVEPQIKSAFQFLYHKGTIVKQKTWQNVESPDDTVEVSNVFLRMRMPETIEELSLQTKASLPWAEDHFQERVNGFPLNPGEQWKNWPYYKHGEDDKRFKETGKFSHTYMERFWPVVGSKEYGNGDFTGEKFIRRGIRFEYGDYNDIIERAKEDSSSRQLYLSIWHPEDQSNGNGRVPCTLGYFFLIREGALDVSYFIRSCDILRHFRNDIYMTIRLAMHFRDQVDKSLILGDLNMWVGSLHCFRNEKEILRKHVK